MFLDKAGWLKKDTGRLLASFKDRYIQVEKTEVVVYENEVHYLCFPLLQNNFSSDIVICVVFP